MEIFIVHLVIYVTINLRYCSRLSSFYLRPHYHFSYSPKYDSMCLTQSAPQSVTLSFVLQGSLIHIAFMHLTTSCFGCPTMSSRNL